MRLSPSTLEIARSSRRGACLLSLLALAGVLTSSNAWATKNPSSVVVGAGTCWGSSYTYLVTVNSSGTGTGSGSMAAPTGLPSGVTASYTDATIGFTGSTTSDTTTLILALGTTVTAGTTGFNVVCNGVAPSTGSPSGAGTLTITAPSISQQPTNQTVCVGSTASFSVVAA